MGDNEIENEGILSNEEIEIELRKLCRKHSEHLTQELLGDFAALLIKCGHKIHRDPRTIRKTNTATVGDVNFVHLGLVKGLSMKIKKGIHVIPV